MLHDLRYAFRMLARSPGFAAAASLSLALGIGANTAIFSLMDAVMLKNLPVKDPEQLYQIVHAGRRGVQEGVNFPLFEQIRDHSKSFSAVIDFNPNLWKVTVNSETEPVYGQCVTGNYYSVLGVRATLGRRLKLDDDRIPRAHPVAVISHAYWKRRFGQDPGVLGKQITINLTPFTIIGVTEPEFFGLQVGRRVDITVPMAMHPLVGSGMPLDQSRGFTQALPIVGRLKPGVTPEQARAEVDVLFQRFLTTWMPSMPEQLRRDFLERAELLPVSNGLGELRKQFSVPLRILMALVAAVLLIACANVANLLLARAAGRQREMAVRLAIGAGRLRLMRLLVTKSLLLAGLGGLLGLAMAFWGIDALVSFIPQGTIPLMLHIRPDARVLGFTMAVALLMGLLCGLAPALRATKTDIGAGLKSHSRTQTGYRGRPYSPWRTLLVAQIAMSLVLITAAGLFVRTLRNLRRVEAGFNRDNILLLRIDCSGTVYEGPGMTGLYCRLLERLKVLPGVRSASFSAVSPLSGTWEGRMLSIPGFAHQQGVDDEVRVNWVAPQYFETMGIPLFAGRDFGPADGESAPRVAIVSESIVRHYFPNQEPLGQRLDLSRQPAGGEIQIVGVAKDVKFEGLRNESPRMVYIPAAQQARVRPYMTFALRTTGAWHGLAASARREVQAAGRDIPLMEVKTLAAQVDESLAQERLVAALSGFLGLLALVLASVGIYGMMAYGVARRTGEIGVRMALGARREDVLWLVLRQALALAAIGVAIGLPAALAATRLVSGMLFGLTAHDPATLAAATAVMIGTAVIAGFLPARRAARIDPMVALRHE